MAARMSSAIRSPATERFCSWLRWSLDWVVSTVGPRSAARASRCSGSTRDRSTVSSARLSLVLTL
jgi:hypothetical protein